MVRYINILLTESTIMYLHYLDRELDEKYILCLTTMSKISFDYNEMRESGGYISRFADIASGHILSSRRIYMHHTTVELQTYIYMCIYISKNDTIYYKFITRIKEGLVVPICNLYIVVAFPYFVYCLGEYNRRGCGVSLNPMESNCKA